MAPQEDPQGNLMDTDGIPPGYNLRTPPPPGSVVPPNDPMATLNIDTQNLEISIRIYEIQWRILEAHGRR